MLNKYCVLALIGLIGLTALMPLASSIKVSQYSGPYKVSFDMLADEVDMSDSSPYTGQPYTSYDLIFTAKKWYMDMVITRFHDPQKVDPVVDGRSIARSLGVSESDIMSRTIDGTSAVYALKARDNGHDLNIIYWLDNRNDSASEKVMIKIMTDDETIDGINKTLDTMKIERIR